MNELCGKNGCMKTPYPGQKYCSKDHAPFGNLGGSSAYTPRIQKEPEAEEDDGSEFVSYALAAKICGVAYMTVVGWVRDGRVEVHREGPRKVRVSRASLAPLIKSASAAVPAEQLEDNDDLEEPDEDAADDTYEAGDAFPDEDDAPPQEILEPMPLAEMRTRIQDAVPEPDPDEGEPSTEATELTDVNLEVARRLVSRAEKMRDRGKPDVEIELLWMSVQELGLTEMEA